MAKPLGPSPAPGDVRSMRKADVPSFFEANVPTAGSAIFTGSGGGRGTGAGGGSVAGALTWGEPPKHIIKLSLSYPLQI